MLIAFKESEHEKELCVAGLDRRIGIADANGRVMLKRMKIKGFTAAANADWDDVRALNLKTLQNGLGDSRP